MTIIWKDAESPLLYRCLAANIFTVFLTPHSFSFLKFSVRFYYYIYLFYQCFSRLGVSV